MADSPQELAESFKQLLVTLGGVSSEATLELVQEVQEVIEKFQRRYTDELNRRKKENGGNVRYL